MKIKPSEARKFHEELCGKHDKGTEVTVEEIAQTMEISTTKAMQYCFAMAYYGIAEKNGNGCVL